MVLAHAPDLDISSLYAHYKNDLKTIRHLHELGEDAHSIIREISDGTDTFILRLFLVHLKTITHRDEPPPHLLLLAQGGYGRRELHPKSDIDIIFLHNRPLKKEEEELIKVMFRTLYDLGFQVGHALRSFKEAIDAAQSDMEIQTSICESRFLVGDWRLFEDFKQDLWKSLKKNRHESIRRKVVEREERIKRYGSTLNITEPHLKESPGGLRDYHFGLWIGSLLESRTMNLLQLKRSNLIDDLTSNRVEKALSFLWRIRSDLHFQLDKEQDLLAMSLQHDLSLRMGYEDQRGRLAEETMMRDYYQHALALREFAESMIREATPRPFWSFLQFKPKKTLPDGFSLRDSRIQIPPHLHFFEHDPPRLLHAFLHAAENNATLSSEAAMAVHDHLDLVDQAFLHDKQHTALVRRFFSLPQGTEKALQEMRRTGFLERLFPEWKSIAHLVRYDLVHRYTVDEHSLLCLYYLEHLLEDPFQYAQERFTLWYNCTTKDVLRLAVLFHDIGKGKSGDHSVIGARLVDAIARRIRLPEFKRKMLVFLVENHLIMSRTAQRRDLADPQVVTEFSDGLDRLEHLNLLYLLTYVDMRSVSPESMTEWKNNLLWELYLLTRNIFIARDVRQAPESLQEVSRKEQIIQSLSEQFEPALVREHLDNLPASYKINTTINQIRQHLAAIEKYDGKTPVIRFYPHLDPACRELVIVCRDKVGLFHRICSAVALENFSIEEARLNTRRDGIVANNIVIRDVIEGKQITEQRQELLGERLEKYLKSEEPIPPTTVMRKKKPLGRSNLENRVQFLNDASTKFTVLEIHCADQYGLLQDLTAILAARNLNIYFARIITEGSRVTDVFYIADLEGEKIYDAELLNELQRALLEYLEKPAQP